MALHWDVLNPFMRGSMVAVALKACPCAPFNPWALVPAVCPPVQLLLQWHWKPSQRSDLAEHPFIRQCSVQLVGTPLVAQAAAMVEEVSVMVEVTVIGSVARLVYSDFW